MTIEPETKDWTWVLDEPCPECGYDADSVAVEEISDRVTAGLDRWAAVLDRPDAGERPAPTTWSPTEYACHVRDVFAVFTERLRLILEEDDPEFANWDQDATAIAGDYAAQLPATVGPELQVAGSRAASAFAAVPADAWPRQGRRSNGSVFTAESLGRYFLHDVEHHLWDVKG